MHSSPDDTADNEITFRDLHRHLMRARRRDTKGLCRLLQSVPVEADAWDRRIVRDEVLSDEVVDHAPVAAVVGVDGLDEATDQRLVLLAGHSTPLVARHAILENASDEH